MSISITVPKTTISVAVAGSTVAAAVTASQISAAASGGVGPQGPTGPQGPSGVTTIGGATDVQLFGLTDGDLLRYSAGKWRNEPELDLVLDGGNFG